MNSSYYDPEIRRFLSPDIFIQQPENSQSYNRYSYCLNNPLNFVDLNGYWWEDYDFDYGDRDNPEYDPYLIGPREYIAFTCTCTGREFEIVADRIYFDEYDDRQSFEMGDQSDYLEDYASEQWGMPGWATDVNSGIGAFNAANGLKSEFIEYAVRSNYKSARTWSEFNNLRSSQQAWRITNTLGKTGASYLKYVKGLGYVGTGLTTTYSAANAGMYYYNGGTSWEVGTKAALDVIMTGVGFLGPIGFGISAAYFILDGTTGGFGGFGEIKP